MKAKAKRVLLVLLAMAVLCTVGAVASHAAVDITAEFTDLGFRNEVYLAIGKSDPDPIYDTDVTGITTLDNFLRYVESFAGIKYLTNLKTLDCSYNGIKDLSELPDSLETLDCSGNAFKLTELPELPANLITLKCGGNYWLAELPALPAGLKTLDCSSNALASLPSLPSGLVTLKCAANDELVELPPLPASLETLHCGWCSLTELPALPVSLKSLSCNNNLLAELPALPLSLDNLNCFGNQLSSIDVTGLRFMTLDCRYNNMVNESKVIGFTSAAYFYYSPQNVPQIPQFYPVTDISGIPTTATADTPLALAGTVAPANATNKTIVWSVASAGTTGATVSGSTLNTTAAGTVTVKATIANGTAPGVAYEKTFSITVSLAPPLPPPALKFSQANYTINYRGSSGGYTAGMAYLLDISPDGGTPPYRYECSSNNAGITIEIYDSGFAQGVIAKSSKAFSKTGSATITVYDAKNNSATCTVTVKPTWWQWLIIILLFGWIWY